MPLRVVVVLAVVGVLALVRILVFPGWSVWLGVWAGIVLIVLGCAVVARRRSTVRLADARGGRLYVARGRGCFEVGGWYYLPRAGPDAVQARRSAYELAASVLDWADRHDVRLAVVPQTEWHDRLYRRMGFTEPAEPGCRLSMFARVAIAWGSTLPVRIRRPGTGMRPDEVAALGVRSA